MPQKNHKRNNMVKAIALLGVLLLISGVVLYATNEWRAEAGWFTAGDAITANNLAYVTFFGLLTGTVIAVVVGYILKMMGRKRI